MAWNAFYFSRQPHLMMWFLICAIILLGSDIMNQEQIGKLIKDLRIKDHLTQAEFANKYGVTFQAVSKWENGKNLPDTFILKQICSDYNININDILDGKLSNKKKNYKYLLFILIAILIFICELIYFNNKNKDNNFIFKTLSSNCEDFKLNGSIAYNNNKTVIYISNIEYCGKNNNEVYQTITCSLYEKNNKEETIINDCNIKNNKNITLKDYFKNINININNNDRICKDYTNDNLYILIKATNNKNETISYNIPLQINNCK